MGVLSACPLENILYSFGEKVAIAQGVPVFVII